MWLVRVLLGYVLGILLHLGVAGVWLAMVIEDVYKRQQLDLIAGALFAVSFLWRRKNCF